jgi:hypothetical protein
MRMRPQFNLDMFCLLHICKQKRGSGCSFYDERYLHANFALVMAFVSTGGQEYFNRAPGATGASIIELQVARYRSD